MDHAHREVLVADVEHADRPIGALLLVDGVHLFLGDVGGRGRLVLGRDARSDCHDPDDEGEGNCAAHGSSLRRTS
jgi:hypothetical protein